MTLSYAQYKDKPPSLALSGDLSLKNMSMKTETDEPLLTLPLLSLTAPSAELFSRKIRLSRLIFQEPELHFRRDRKGSLDLSNLFSSPPPGPASNRHEESGETTAWLLMAERIEVKDGKLHFADSSLTHPVRVSAEAVQLAIEDFSTAENARSPVSCSLRIGHNGRASMKGSASLRPVAADLEVSLKEIDLSPLQAYAEERVNLLVNSASLSAEGKFEAAREKDGGIRGSYKGNALFSKFSSKDGLTRRDLVKWESLSFKSVELSFQPFSVALRDVALTDYYARIVVHPDGRLNLQEVLRPKSGKAQSASSDISSRRITLNTLTLQGGEIDFLDRHIRPPYSARLLDVGGRISGLSSQEKTAADVDLQGKINNYAPIEITGKINPLRKDLYMDLKGSVKGFDLTPLSPFSARYVGYTVEKGKLFLEMEVPHPPGEARCR
jgi:Domain of Unknown Function (DUF748)